MKGDDLVMTQHEMDLEEFDCVQMEVNRAGWPEFIQYLKGTDYLECPASSKYHLAQPGGLLRHSLNVTSLLRKKRSSPFWGPLLEKYSEESLVLVGLCHDLCKTDCYDSYWKNEKSYDPKIVADSAPYQIKHDNQGDYVWISRLGYRYDEQEPFGNHGDKSVIMLQQYIKLTPDEIYAIRYHMLFSGDDNPSTVGNALQRSPFLTLALAESDMEATFILENGENEG